MAASTCAQIVDSCRPGARDLGGVPALAERHGRGIMTRTSNTEHAILWLARIRNNGYRNATRRRNDRRMARIVYDHLDTCTMTAYSGGVPESLRPDYDKCKVVRLQGGKP